QPGRSGAARSATCVPQIFREIIKDMTTRRTVVLALLLLPACAVLQPEATVDRIVADALGAARAPAAEQKAALAAAQGAFARDPGRVNRLRLAPLLAFPPAPLRDDARAAELYEPLANPSSPGPGRFAALMSTQLAERQRVTRERERADK